MSDMNEFKDENVDDFSDAARDAMVGDICKAVSVNTHRMMTYASALVDSALAVAVDGSVYADLYKDSYEDSVLTRGYDDLLINEDSPYQVFVGRVKDAIGELMASISIIDKRDGSTVPFDDEMIEAGLHILDHVVYNNIIDNVAKFNAVKVAREATMDSPDEDEQWTIGQVKEYISGMEVIERQEAEEKYSYMLSCKTYADSDADCHWLDSDE